jgi:hypothetical protein
MSQQIDIEKWQYGNWQTFILWLRNKWILEKSHYSQMDINAIGLFESMNKLEPLWESTLERVSMQSDECMNEL